jgi:hypothetical protein
MLMERHVFTRQLSVYLRITSVTIYNRKLWHQNCENKERLSDDVLSIGVQIMLRVTVYFIGAGTAQSVWRLATGWMAEGPELEYWPRQDFLSSPGRPDLGRTSLLSDGYRQLFPRD